MTGTDRSLSDLQALFVRALTWPTGVRAFLDESDAATRDAFCGAFVDAGDLDAVARLDVYAESYFWRLHAVVEETFSVLAWVVGEARFRNLTTDYVLARPSRHFDLHRFGERFAAYVDEHAISAMHPELGDLARIEYAIAAALHVEDEPPIGIDALASIPPGRWPELRFRATRSASLWAGRWAYTALSAQRMTGTSAPSLPRESPRVATLVWRDRMIVHDRGVGPDEAAALACLLRGGSFSEICAIVADAHGHADAPGKVVGWLRDWLGAGLLTHVES